MELNLDKVSKKHIKFNWTDALQSTKIDIRIPDLKGLECESWGDWGPTYDFYLNPEEPIVLEIDQKKRKLDQKVLRIESPILAVDRKKTPYFFVIEDKELGFRFSIYLDKNFNLHRVSATRYSECHDYTQPTEFALTDEAM